MSHDAACAQSLLHINESNMRHESKAIPFTEPAPESDVQISSKFPVKKRQGRKKNHYSGQGRKKGNGKGASNGLRGIRIRIEHLALRHPQWCIAWQHIWSDRMERSVYSFFLS